MKVGPSEPLYGGRFQTTVCCVGWRPSWWATREKAHSIASGGDQEDGAQSRVCGDRCWRVVTGTRWHQNQGESGVPWEEPGGWPL